MAAKIYLLRHEVSDRTVVFFGCDPHDSTPTVGRQLLASWRRFIGNRIQTYLSKEPARIALDPSDLREVTAPGKPDHS